VEIAAHPFDGGRTFGGPTELTDRAQRIQLFKQELRQHPIAGDIYTQATNIEDERNGLIDPHTGELSVPTGLLNSRIYSQPAPKQNFPEKPA
jgi:hypothetical protein